MDFHCRSLNFYVYARPIIHRLYFIYTRKASLNLRTYARTNYALALRCPMSTGTLGSITSRCSGNKPALLLRKESLLGEEKRPDTRERRKSSLLARFLEKIWLELQFHFFEAVKAFCQVIPLPYGSHFELVVCLL